MKQQLRDIIYEKIWDFIASGKLAPGERLVEDHLSEEFNTSRSPVREALRRLETEGLVTQEKKRGISVSKLSVKQIDEIFAVRALLESFAVHLTADKVTKEDVALLKKYHNEQKQAAKDINIVEWLRINSQFHSFFSNRCGNEILAQLIENLRRRVRRYHFITVNVPWQFEKYLEHHEGMIRGCELNDGEMAEKYMRIHMNTIREALVKQLNARGVVYEQP